MFQICHFDVGMMLFQLGLLLLFIGLASGGNIQGVAVNNTLTLGYLVYWDQGWRRGPVIASAIILAKQEIIRRQLLPGYQIEWVLRDDKCEPQHGMQVTIN